MFFSFFFKCSNKRRFIFLDFLISAALHWILGAALIRGRRLKEGGAYYEKKSLGAALIGGRRLKEGGAYQRKYGSLNY